VIPQELVKCGAGFVGADGEVRYVHMIHRPGNGYGVSWDSLPPPTEVKAVLEWYQARPTRPHGYMPMRKFQAWAKQAASTQEGAKNG